MLDGSSSNGGSVLALGNGSTRDMASSKNPSMKNNREERYTKYKRSSHTKDPCYKLHGKEKVFECMQGHKGPHTKSLYFSRTCHEKDD
ncbi:hypothetical protein CR513_22404, partial [Mucuna pruriens]